MKKIDYEKIITTIDFICDIEDSDILSTIASIELNKLKRENFAKINIHTRAREISSTGVYANYNKTEREFIAVNIMYDDVEFINFLLELNITFDTLKCICKTIESFKNISTMNASEIIFQSEHYKALLSLLDRICSLAKKRFETRDNYLTINKLAYLVTYGKELYLTLEKEKVKKPQ